MMLLLAEASARADLSECRGSATMGNRPEALANQGMSCFDLADKNKGQNQREPTAAPITQRLAAAQKAGMGKGRVPRASPAYPPLPAKTTTFHKFVMGPVPKAIRDVAAKKDIIAEQVQVVFPNLPRHDDIVLQEHLGRAFAGTDGCLWKLDLRTNTAGCYVKTPLMAMGLRSDPKDENILYFCASRLSAKTYPKTEKVGLYQLDIESKRIEPIVTRVPLLPALSKPPAGNQGTVFSPIQVPYLTQDQMNEANSRPMALCNDLDISPDGREIYIAESLDYEGASMGPGAIKSVLSLEPESHLWRYEPESRRVGLAAQGYAFLDGILMEPSEDGKIRSLLVTELTKFRILRLHLDGEKAGRDKVLWENLPGMPDGLHRDAEGRVYLGLVKERTGFVTWLHAHPTAKRIVSWLVDHGALSLIPQPKGTGVLVFNRDLSQPLLLAMHPNKRVTEISAAIPGADGKVYLPSFDPNSTGMHVLPKLP